MPNLPQFVIDLGVGLYMDSGGKVLTSAPAGMPVYELPGGLPVAADSVISADDRK